MSPVFDLQISPHSYQWGGEFAYREAGQITGLVYHHSAGPLSETVDEIHAQHLDQGWAGIGYHVVVYPSGEAVQGRPFNAVPAAAQGYNTASLDVCLIGNFQADDAGYTGPPTAAQLATAKRLCRGFHVLYPSIERTIGHRDVSTLVGDPSVATACPGSDFYSLLPQVRASVNEK